VGPPPAASRPRQHRVQVAAELLQRGLFLLHEHLSISLGAHRRPADQDPRLVQQVLGPPGLGPVADVGDAVITQRFQDPVPGEQVAPCLANLAQRIVQALQEDIGLA